MGGEARGSGTSVTCGEATLLQCAAVTAVVLPHCTSKILQHFSAIGLCTPVISALARLSEVTAVQYSANVSFALCSAILVQLFAPPAMHRLHRSSLHCSAVSTLESFCCWSIITCSSSSSNCSGRAAPLASNPLHSWQERCTAICCSAALCTAIQ